MSSTSGITAVHATTTPVDLGGRAWRRTTGTVHGVVDPRARRVEVYHLERGSYTLLADLAGEAVIESPTIAGLALPVAGLFPSE